MNEPVNEQNKKKPLRNPLFKKKYVLSVLIMDLLIIFLAVLLLKEEPPYYPHNESIFRKYIENNNFAEVEHITISDVTLSDIKPLKKFTNLKDIYIYSNFYSREKIPVWRKLLAKLHIPNISNQNTIDLSPLKKLYKLEKIRIHNKPVKNIRPLSNLVNLKELDLRSTTVRDISPLRNLKNLEHLNLSDNPVSNLEPLKNLENLKSLGLIRCPNITKEQIADLKKALPNLSVTTQSL